ncbi:MAG: carbohydrate ABC transporter permease [Anaerolineaceae bacterium]
MMKKFFSHFKKAPITILLLIGGVVMVIPFLYMISAALTPNLYVIQYPPELIPSNASLDNFIKAWQANNFQQYFLNSALVSITATIVTVMFAAMAAYAFARFDFKGKEAIFFAFLAVMMVPTTILIVPQFLLMKNLGLRNSLGGLILIYSATSIPSGIFLLRGFFEQLPKELEEAALLEGANYFTTFTKIMLPLSAPGLATVSIFSFMGFWDEFIMALTFIDEPARRTLPIAIALFQGQHGTQWGLVFAASLIALIPVIIVFFSLQKYFAGGITAGAIKG